METCQMYIDGQWCDSESGRTFDAINPATGKPFARVPRGTRADARRAIAAANEAFETWSQVPLWERADLCVRMADLVEAQGDALASILCTELGKPRYGEAVEEAAETPANFRYAAEQAKWLEGATIPVQDASKRVFSIRRPRGVITVLTPWNFTVLSSVPTVAAASRRRPSMMSAASSWKSFCAVRTHAASSRTSPSNASSKSSPSSTSCAHAQEKQAIATKAPSRLMPACSPSVGFRHPMPSQFAQGPPRPCRQTRASVVS